MNFTWDIWLFLGLIVGGLVYGFAVGRDRALTVLISTYVALAVVTNAPILGRLNAAFGALHPTLQFAWFVFLFGFVFVVMWRSQLMRSLARDRGAWWEAALFSVMQVGLTASATLYLLPAEITNSFSPIFRETFSGEIGRSFWLIAPIVFLAVLGASSAVEDEDEEDEE
ncbi:hypothetical protein IT407_04930 [Candidatus Uhrbacteria bacterium]|nr:hypothetical protein [Candidatus Uhrbacteria bacterium]